MPLLPHTFLYDAFASSPNPIYKEAFDKVAVPMVLDLSSNAAFPYERKIFKKEYVTLSDRQSHNFMHDQYSDFFGEDEPFYFGDILLKMYTGFVVKKGSPLLPLLDRHISWLVDTGVVQYAVRRRFTYKVWVINRMGKKKSTRDESRGEKFGLRHFSFQFLLYACGIGAAAVMFIIECFAEGHMKK